MSPPHRGHFFNFHIVYTYPPSPRLNPFVVKTILDLEIALVCDFSLIQDIVRKGIFVGISIKWVNAGLRKVLGNG